MKKILMVCLGNTCRSPLAGGVLKKILRKKNIEAIVESAGFEPYNIGEGPDERALIVAKKHGIDLEEHKMRLFRKEDFKNFDFIYVMDQRNLRDVLFLAESEEDKKKVDYLMNVLNPGKNQIIPDPYYGDLEDYEYAVTLMQQACERLAESLR
ncbi:MAG TPA: low molecular weight protein-tyrosine-phosphatase [Bacteroidales bacterium]|nr:low molecular weight protein-tyrosine-phosphatase [Bacteroidales bacterium]